MQDSFGRNISYLRLSVTDRCDLRCFYCLPRDHRDFVTPESWLKPDEVSRVVRIFNSLGVDHVRLTGGEPLVRRELPEIVQGIAAVEGLRDLSLSTNATRMNLFAERLHAAGIRRLNISLDTLDPVMFKQITGGELSRVLRGIDAAVEAGFSPIKINMVVMKGLNHDQVGKMIDYCGERGLSLRLIETMPIGQGGRDASEHYISLKTIENALRKDYQLQPAAMQGSGPARYFQVDDRDQIIGFITPQSQHFCDTCNRVRLSVDGDLHLCLAQEDKLPLRPLLRDGSSDEQIRQAIVTAIARKPERHHFNEVPEQIIRPMSALGG